MIDAIVIGAGQSGLTAARTLADHHLTPVVLEAGPDPVESWPHYYDSLTLYSPAQIGAERSGPDVAESQPARRDRRADAGRRHRGRSGRGDRASFRRVERAGRRRRRTPAGR
ncbi:NAD(P)-binding protein [Nocardia puris]|uniref:NAD(P)-binding protein n=1 Tax=Nocardia puris TaxID=208602 RepID=UPI003F6A10EE